MWSSADRDICPRSRGAILAEPGQSAHGAARAARGILAADSKEELPCSNDCSFFAYGLARLSDLPRRRSSTRSPSSAASACRRPLDGAPGRRWACALAIDRALLTVFAVQHSVMARRWFKECWTQIVPWAIERSTYVLCASLALLLLFWQWRPIGIEIWTVENARAARRPAGRCSPPAGRTCSIVTFLINHFDLFGLRQVWLPLIGKPYTRDAVPHAAALPLRAASALLRLPARVLDDADDDAGAPRVRGRHDRLHRARDPVRGARSRRRARRGLRGVPPARADAGARRHRAAPALAVASTPAQAAERPETRSYPRPFGCRPGMCRSSWAMPWERKAMSARQNGQYAGRHSARRPRCSTATASSC